MFIVPILEHLARRRLNSVGVRSRYAYTRGGRLHYYEALNPAAKGPPIVIFHGFGASATSFGRVIAALRPHSPRILAPDTPGHGFSPAPHQRLTLSDLYDGLDEVLQRELSEPAIVVGNSLGGAMAVRFADRNPDKIRGVVLSSPAGAPLPEAHFRELVDSFRPRGFVDASRLIARLYDQPPWFRAIVAPDLLRHFRQPHFRHLLETFSQEESLQPEELASIRAPTLILWGRGERLLPGQSLDFFRTHLPAQGRIEEPEGFGHCPNLDRPRQLARRIAEFAQST
ncbi:MAG: alpha/beta hydrolase [Nannocystaceae bacterium]